MPDVAPEATPGQAPPWECPNHPGTWVITGACIACIDRYPEMVNVATRIAAERDRLAAENASLREQLSRTETQCRRHVNKADAGAARYKAERDDYAARLKATDQSWTAVARERDAAEARSDKLEADLTAVVATLTALGNSHANLRQALERIRDDEHPYGSYSRDIARAALGGDAP